MLRLSSLLSFLAVALVAAGCQPRVAPPPPAQPSAGVAEAGPAAPTGDPALDTFLAEIAAEIDLHDWSGVSDRMAPERLAEATAEGVAAGLSTRDAHARVVGQALGLRDLVSGSDARAALDRVRVVTLRTVYAVNDLPGVTTRVEGDVRLGSGETLPLVVEILRDGDAYRLVAPRRPTAR